MDDGCYYHTGYSNKRCYQAENASDFDKYTGETYGFNSRCLDSNVARNGADLKNNNNVAEVRCLEVKCNADASEVSVLIHGQEYPCDKSSSTCKVTPSGSNPDISGNVDLPSDWYTFCHGTVKACLNYCSSNGYC